MEEQNKKETVKNVNKVQQPEKGKHLWIFVSFVIISLVDVVWKSGGNLELDTVIWGLIIIGSVGAVAIINIVITLGSKVANASKKENKK